MKQFNYFIGFALILLIMVSFSRTHSESSFRLILLFGNTESPYFANQLDILKSDTAGIRERHVEIRQVTTDNPSYKEYEVDPGSPFTFILVGKDGGEKLRSQKPVSLEKLFVLIDAMPMRKAEMKQQKRNEDL